MIDKLKRFFRSGKYPLYFRGGNVFVKAESATKYRKVFINPALEIVDNEFLTKEITPEEIFTQALGYVSITAKRFDAQIEKMNNSKVLASSEKPVRFVFECGGRDYYTYVNANEMPSGRQQEMEVVLMEYDARASRETILETLDKIIACADNTVSVKLSDITSQAKILKARMNLLFDFSLYKKLASVMYFDEAEDTTTYDTDYNLKKIAHWNKHGGDAFFLAMPVKNLLPFGEMSVQDFRSFIQKNLAKLRLIQAGILETTSSDTSIK